MLRRAAPSRNVPFRTRPAHRSGVALSLPATFESRPEPAQRARHSLAASGSSARNPGNPQQSSREIDAMRARIGRQPGTRSRLTRAMSPYDHIVDWTKGADRRRIRRRPKGAATTAWRVRKPRGWARQQHWMGEIHQPGDRKGRSLRKRVRRVGWRCSNHCPQLGDEWLDAGRGFTVQDFRGPQCAPVHPSSRSRTTDHLVRGPHDASSYRGQSGRRSEAHHRAS